MRGTATERGYDQRWRGFRQWWLNRLIGFGVTVACGARWPDAPATMDSRCAVDRVLNSLRLELDHVVPFMADGTVDERLLFDPLNIQALCKRCHSAKTAMQDSRFARRSV